MWFIPAFLGIDVISLIRNDPRAKRDRERGRRAGTFRAADQETELVDKGSAEQDNGVDQAGLWRRLAAEGATMKGDLSKLGRPRPADSSQQARKNRAQRSYALYSKWTK